MNINFDPTGRQPKSIFSQVLTWVVWALLLGAALMFSLVFFAVVAVAGLILWVYFWWKTRAIREQLREQMRAQANGPGDSEGFGAQSGGSESGGEIIEGEARRVPDEREKLPR